jgi:tetratricopeptide (TPR) repeat protein
MSVLDVEVLHAVLPDLKKGREVGRRWDKYSRLSFMSPDPGDEQRILFHPVVRQLLLDQLLKEDPTRDDYSRIHTQLRDHFQKRASKGEDQARLEEAYHALALGEAEGAIRLGIEAQRSRLPLWPPLVEAVTQAPTDLVPNHTEERADEALTRANEQHEVQSAVTAALLYTWLLNPSQGDRKHAAHLEHKLGIAYIDLPGGDRAANLGQAIACCQAALQVLTREAFPFDWARTQTNLGNAYSDLPGGDRAANFKQAIACYQAALQVRTREAFPVDWAQTQNSLGLAYWNLPGGDRAANLKQAIACYQAALQVRTREAFPVQWAQTQTNLGIAYIDLPGGDRQANLEQAIACYQAALQIFSLARMDYYSEVVSRNLEEAQDALQKLEQSSGMQ